MLNLLYFYISTFRSICAVPNRAVFCKDKLTVAFTPTYAVKQPLYTINNSSQVADELLKAVNLKTGNFLVPDVV